MEARWKLILITGMAGSGKTTLSKIIKDSGIRVITMGDVIRDLAKQKDMEPSTQNLGILAKQIREEGPDAVARRCIDLLNRMNPGLIVVDGMRSIAEHDAFKENFDVILIAVHASPLSRFKRLTRRGRSDDPQSWEEFRERDRRELSFGIGGAISCADVMIINDNGIGGLKESWEKLMERITND